VWAMAVVKVRVAKKVKVRVKERAVAQAVA
jgi:hypothetical protein